MSLKDALTEHANILRTKTGLDITLSIYDMTRLLGDLSWNKKNLLKGTSDEWKSIPLLQWGQVSSATNNRNFDISNYPVGSYFTYALTIINKDNVDICLEMGLVNKQGIDVTGYNTASRVIERSSDEVHLYTTIKKLSSDFVGLNAWIISKSANGNNNPVQVKDERLYEGTEPGIWTPNPSDLTGGGRISHSASVMLPNHFNRLEVKVA